MALHMHISCFSPKLRSDSLISALSPFAFLETRFDKEALFNSSIISSSVFKSSGSRLNLRVFSNMLASCGMTVMLSRRSAIPTSDISTPSISMKP